LIIRFWPVDEPLELVRAGHRALRLIGEISLDLERDVAVVPARAVPDGAHEIAGPLDVLHGQPVEDVLRRVARRRARMSSSYRSESDTALAKIDGFDVPPVTLSSAMIRSNNPLSRAGRATLSYQTLWPSASSSVHLLGMAARSLARAGGVPRSVTQRVYPRGSRFQRAAAADR
jgi:hypothetical protein